MNLDENRHEEIIDVPEGMEIAPEGEKDSREGKTFNRFLLLFYVFLLAAVLLAIASPYLSTENKKPSEKETTSAAEEVISVTEAALPEATESAPPPETQNQQETAQKEASPETEDLSWQETIFGGDPRSVITAPMKVTGLTENEKNLLRFRESDFIRSLSSFLVANNIHVSGISFTGPAACSAGDATGYTATLNGITDRKLIAMFFPRYSGRYLFVLETVKKEETPERETPGASQAAPAPSTPVQSAPAVSAQPENDYDAMNLTIRKIPGELANYLSNPYELQYELYDYLYGRGHKDIRVATVTDYSIDSEERSATIYLSAESAGKVICVYSLDRNSYSFR